MRIMIKDPSYQIDRGELTRCMADMGFTPAEINRLTLTIRDQGTKDVQREEKKNDYTLYGCFRGVASITIYTHNDIAENVSDTIIHELSHYLDSAKRDRELAQAVLALKPGEYSKFWLKWAEEGNKDRSIDYERDPAEIRARIAEETLGPLYQIVKREK